MAADDKKCIFLTVGTTSFDKLVQTVCEQETCRILQRLGYTDVLLQIGRGQFEPSCCDVAGVRIDFYRFKDSLVQDIQCADLVISHAGAGTCLEVLDAQRPLLVVINEDLMGNHQEELAQKLREDSHCLYTTCRNLPSALESMDLSGLQPLEAGKPDRFASFLDKVMGVS